MAGTKTLRGSSWYLRVDAGTDPLTGRRRQRTKTLPPGPDGKPLGIRAANDELTAFAAEVKKGTAATGNRSLQALFDAFIEARPRMSPGTREEWQRDFANRVPEPLRSAPIGKIEAYTLDQLYLRLLLGGGVCRKRDDKCVGACKHGGGTPLSPASVDRVHTILSAIFRQAVKWGWLDAAPTERATPPELEQAEVVTPDVADVVKLLDYIAKLDVHESPLPDFVPLLVSTGARPGELCAAKVGDVDMTTGRLWVRRSFSRGDGGTVKETKTRKARALKVDDATLARLDARRIRLARLALTCGVPLDDMWWFPSPGAPDRPWWPSSMSREFRAARDAVGLDGRMTLRNVRHFVASVLLAEGVDVRTTAGRLGHGANVTLGVYAHVLTEADDEAAGVVAGVLDRAREAKADGR